MELIRDLLGNCLFLHALVYIQPYSVTSIKVYQPFAYSLGSAKTRDWYQGTMRYPKLWDLAE